MDSMDDSPVPLWPIDELRLEEINTIGIGEYDNYSGGDIVVEEVRPPLNFVRNRRYRLVTSERGALEYDNSGMLLDFKVVRFELSTHPRLGGANWVNCMLWEKWGALMISEQNDEVSDTTGDDSSTEAGNINIYLRTFKSIPL